MSAWTSTPPTEPGWYWWRFNRKDDEPIVRPVSTMDIWRGRCQSGQWQGPLTPEE